MGGGPGSDPNHFGEDGEELRGDAVIDKNEKKTAWAMWLLTMFSDSERLREIADKHKTPRPFTGGARPKPRIQCVDPMATARAAVTVVPVSPSLNTSDQKE